MAVASCPKCKARIALVPGEQPVCPGCGTRFKVPAPKAEPVAVAVPVINASIDAAAGTSYPYEVARIFFSMGTAPDAALKSDINTAVSGLITDGVWNKVDVLYVAQVNSADQFLNWKNPSTNAPTVAGAPTFVANRHYSYDGVDDCHILYNASTAALNYTQNSNCGFVRSTVNAQMANPVMGVRNGSTSTAQINPRGTSDTTTFRAQDNTGGETIAETDARGMWSWNRSASNARQYYKNGVAYTLTNPTAASVALVNSGMRMGGAGGSLPVFAACSISYCGFGGSMTAGDHLALYNRMETYVTARNTH